MSTEEIKKGNELIVKFMGGYQRDRNGTQVWDHEEWDSPLAGGKYVFTYDLKYHSSWDWLHPVIEKILKWYDIESDLRFVELMEATQEEDVLRIIDMKIRSTISEVWQAVIQFIMWYNQQGTKINR